MSISLDKDFQDSVVAGYRLGKCLGRSPHSAAYETEYQDGGKPAVIKVQPGDALDAERQLATWQAALDLHHVNLIRMYAAGRDESDGHPVIYAVMERAEETLEGVVAERALTPEETRDLLDPMLAALSFLHQKGYAHSSLKPSNIMAEGDTVKLSIDRLRSLQDGGRPADDVWSLGAVLVQALEHEAPAISTEGEPYILRNAPELFTVIVRHSLDPDPDRRWTVGQIEQFVNPQAASPAPVPVQAPAREEIREVPKPAAVLPMQPRREPPPRTEPDEPGVDRRKWVYAAIAAVIAAAILFALFRRSSNTQPVPAVVTPSTSAEQTPPASAPLSPTPLRDAAQAAHTQPSRARVEPERENVAAPAAASERSEGWVVVVGSYLDRAAAERRVSQLAHKSKRFKVELLEVPGQKNMHLVVIGHHLSADKAASLRKRAVSSGFPRDTYIKRLS